MTESYRKYRPKKFADVVAQKEAVSVLEGHFNGNVGPPHCVCFCGPTGVGKTTLARISARRLHCDSFDLIELNAADFKGIDTVRDIRRTMYQIPLGRRGTRVYIFDEAHKLTNDAQNALLKVLEEPPDHAYFILCTTDPSKLLAAVKGRCKAGMVVLGTLSEGDLRTIVEKIARKEGLDVSEDVFAKITELAEGSARDAIQMLDAVRNLPAEEQ